MKYVSSKRTFSGTKMFFTVSELPVHSKVSFPHVKEQLHSNILIVTELDKT